MKKEQKKMRDIILNSINACFFIIVYYFLDNSAMIVLKILIMRLLEHIITSHAKLISKYGEEFYRIIYSLAAIVIFIAILILFGV